MFNGATFCPLFTALEIKRCDFVFFVWLLIGRQVQVTIIYFTITADCYLLTDILLEIIGFFCSRKQILNKTIYKH